MRTKLRTPLPGLPQLIFTANYPDFGIVNLDAVNDRANEGQGTPRVEIANAKRDTETASLVSVNEKRIGASAP